MRIWRGDVGEARSAERAVRRRLRADYLLNFVGGRAQIESSTAVGGADAGLAGAARELVQAPQSPGPEQIWTAECMTGRVFRRSAPAGAARELIQAPRRAQRVNKFTHRSGEFTVSSPIVGRKWPVRVPRHPVQLFLLAGEGGANQVKHCKVGRFGGGRARSARISSSTARAR